MAVIFDLDGTLIDSAPDIHASVNRMLAEVGEGPIGFASVLSFIGNGLPILIDRVIAARGLHQPPAALRAIFLRHYTAVSATPPRIYPNVRDALSDLAKPGHTLAICTNKPEGLAREILAALQIDHLFGTVIGGDTLPVHKPDPAPLHAAHAALGKGPVIFVGDSEVDAQTAQNASLPFVLFTEGYRKSPVEDLPHAAAFGDFANLPGIVARLLGGGK